MALRIVWSPEALEDVESIAAYISRDSEFYARAVVSKILQIARGFGEFPRAGRIVPELEDEAIRERFVYSYRLIYRIEQQSVLVVAVVHGRRLLESVMERFPSAT